MYDVKNMPLSFARKTIAQKNNRQWKDVSLPKYYLKDWEVNAGSYRVIQQRPLFCHFDRAAVQLRQDDAKLVASSYGTDPSIGQIGLTAHHIIPSSLLECFYDICESKQGANRNIKKALNEWKRMSVKSAKLSAEHRDSGMNFSSNNNPNFAETVKSACVWMNGNVFIGPSANCRIDDTGDKFDYGGYRLSEESPLWTDVKTGNTKMDFLEELYDKLIYIKKENQKPSPDSNLNNDIIWVLEYLSHLACEDHTIHKKKDAKNSAPAYNPNDWICIGNEAILGREKKSELNQRTYTFREMYDFYLRYSREENTILKDFCNLFKKNIKKEMADRIREGNDISCVMSKHTYVILCRKWQECLDKFPQIQ